MDSESFSIGKTASGAGVVFSREERERHVWIVGKSGSGKSTVLFNLAMGDIHAGEGVAVIDPHGDLAEDILDAIPRSRINDVCYLDAGETDYPVGFNPAERGSLPPAKRVPFFVHVDEFQTFSSEAFASLLSEARKFATHFCLANQYADQLSDVVRSAVIGNAGTLIVFRVGSRDAELLAPEFRPMDPAGLADQEPHTAWLRRGVGRDRITAEDRLYAPLGSAAPIREQSRQRFGRPREVIEKRPQAMNA